MPDDDFDDDQNDEPEHIRDLRAKAKRASELEARIAQMEREAAFTKALGPAAEHPGAKYFVKGYDGELTVDAIKAAATEAGFLQAQQDDQQPPDLDAHQRIANASSGAAAPGAERLEDAIAKANSPEEVLAVMERAGFPTSRNAY